MKQKLRMIIGVIISAVCVYLVLRTVEQDQVIAEFSSARYDLILAALGCTLLSYVLRSFRWKYLFEDIVVPFSTSYRALILGFFMNNVLPARIGELIRSHSMGKRLGKSKSYVLATVASERLADGLSISFVFLGISYYGSSLDAAPGVLTTVAMFFLAAGLGTFGVLLLRFYIFRLLRKIDAIIGKKSMSFLIVRVQRFISGLEPLLHPTLLSRVIVFSAVIWGVELYVYQCIGLAFGQDLTLPQLALFLAAVNFSSLVPAAPGGVGVIEAFATFALVRVGISNESALAMVVAQHMVQIFAVGIPGLYFTFFENERFSTEELSA